MYACMNDWINEWKKELIKNELINQSYGMYEWI